MLGAGLAGCTAALQAARNGFYVDLFDRLLHPVRAASLYNEGKLYLGYVYAADPDQATHQRLAKGSLRFLYDLEALTGAPRTEVPVSRPFFYAVPDDSLFAADAVEAHLESVDQSVSALLRDGVPYPVPFQPSRRVSAIKAGVNEQGVSAVFETSEVAVDTGWVADLLGAAVLSSPQIVFKGGARHSLCPAGRQ